MGGALATLRQLLLGGADDLRQSPGAMPEFDRMPRVADSQHRFEPGRRDVRLGVRVEQLGVDRAIEQMEREL